LQAVLYLAVLMPVSVLPFVCHVAGWPYVVVALGLGAVFTGIGVQGWLRKGDAVWAKRFFGVSLLYLTGLFTALGLSGGHS
jgi:protoheme IX farnesyltransferase